MTIIYKIHILVSKEAKGHFLIFPKMYSMEDISTGRELPDSSPRGKGKDDGLFHPLQYTSMFIHGIYMFTFPVRLELFDTVNSELM